MKKIIAFYLLSATAFGYFISPDINKEVQKDINKINILEYEIINNKYIKIFSSENIATLESLVNDFIKDKEIIDIQFQTQLQARFATPFYSVLIIYK